MIEKIFLKLGYVPFSKITELSGMYGEQIRKITNEKLALKTELASKQEIKVENEYVDVGIGDPIPSNQEERKIYVAQVAGFHKQILEAKMNQMLSVTSHLLGAVENERDFDLILKGVIYTLNELKKWGASMINEHLANQNEEQLLENKTN